MEQPKTSKVDLLVIGAGASGTMAATCCAAYGLKSVRVIDKRPSNIKAGHADGVTARTMEILHTFGMSNRILPECAALKGPNFWNADASGGKRIEKMGMGGWINNLRLSRFGSHTLSQATLQDILWDEYVEGRIGLRAERGTITEKLDVSPDQEYPVHVTVRKRVSQIHEANGNSTIHPKANGLQMNSIRLDDDDDIIAESQRGKTEQEVIQAKYVVACDGAHSWTRRQLGIPMLGDDTDMIWGVMDIQPITDFPAARLVNYIISKEERSGLLWIPRERGLVRIYCALAEFTKNSASSSTAEESSSFRSSVTEKSIFENIKRNLRQFSISYTYCEWWAAYQIGQRVTPDNIDDSGRIFLVGDAVHTHSPKAGQGMNVSMADTHNLIWKLNLVLKGVASPTILETYRSERLVVGQRLVAFDRAMAAMASGREAPEIPEGMVGADDLIHSGKGAAQILILGLDVIYPPSCLTANREHDVPAVRKAIGEGDLPKGIVTGMRMPSFDVRVHGDTRLLNLGDFFTAEGCRFQFILFCGDLTNKQHSARLHKVATDIGNLAVPKGLIDVLTVHTSDPDDLMGWIHDLPDICHPFDAEKGYDYDKLFYDKDLWDARGLEITSAYEQYGIDPENGHLVLLRPDAFVALQCALDDFDPVKKFFEGFVIS